MTERCAPPPGSRYARQLVLEGFGPEGQRRVGRGAVVVRGDGPGAALALRYLVGAGVGSCHGDAVPPEELAALNPEPRLGPGAAAPAGAVVVDPAGVVLDASVTGGEPPLPELQAAVAATRALRGLLRDEEAP